MRPAFLAALSLVALQGVTNVSKADDFQTDNLAGTITVNRAASSASAGALKFSLNYIGAITFDKDTIDALSPALQIDNSFIADGGSLTLTLASPFGTLSYNSADLPPGSSQPTLVVEKNKPVAFDFSVVTEGSVPVDLSFSAPLPNPVKPGSGKLSYPGVRENISLVAGLQSIEGKSVPKFTVVPEPSTLVLIGLGGAFVSLLACVASLHRSQIFRDL